MTDRVHPAAKPNPPPPAAAAAVNGKGPAKTNQLYNPNRPRPVYRPPNKNRRSRSCSCRKCCCLGFLYTLIALLVLLLLAAIAACIFYLLYHPKHPTFTVSSLRVHRFNITQPDPTGFAHLNSQVDLTLTAKNPNNKKISFVYDPMLVALGSAGGVDLGNATLPGFAHVAGNTTILRATVASDPTRVLDKVGQLRSDLKKNRGFPVKLVLNMMVEVEMGKMKTKKVGVRVTCEGIKGFQPNKKMKNGSSKKVGSTLGITSSSNCKVVLRIKIWKFTF